MDTIGAHKKSIEVIENKLKEDPDSRVLSAMLGMKYLANKNYSEEKKEIIKIRMKMDEYRKQAKH